MGDFLILLPTKMVAKRGEISGCQTRDPMTRAMRIRRSVDHMSHRHPMTPRRLLECCNFMGPIFLKETYSELLIPKFSTCDA